MKLGKILTSNIVDVVVDVDVDVDAVAVVVVAVVVVVLLVFDCDLINENFKYFLMRNNIF